MKVAISVSDLSPESRLDPRFGRALAFVLVDTETGERQVLANPAASTAGGAGVQAAEFVIRHGAEVVISGTFGPNAAEVLNAANVGMYRAGSGTVGELVEKCQSGELEAATESAGRRGRRGRRGR
jgi:predicted Fe-Mo cluster-binding NifX family protein